MINQLGAYGQWLAGLMPEIPRLSFRNPAFVDLEDWRQQARARFQAALMQPESGGVPDVDVLDVEVTDGVVIEHLRWQLPFGPRTRGAFLRPAQAKGPLPGVLALYDHGGEKFFGTSKIARCGAPRHPIMRRHHAKLYDGRAWANVLARQGFGVLVHDIFGFGSRRLRLSEQPETLHFGAIDPDAGDEAAITAYNRAAAAQETTLAKAFFAAGTSWPGIFASEDQRALDVLCARPEIDPGRVGVCGFSGGGLRATYLAGLDSRPQAIVVAGMLTCWRDFVLNKAHTHTWMVYPPGLPADLDYPDILSITAPKPVLVLSGRDDALFSSDEVARAGAQLAEIYAKAGAAPQFKHVWHDSPHAFGLAMQTQAFGWLQEMLVLPSP